MNVLICDPISPKGIEYFKQQPGMKVTVLEKRLPEADTLERGTIEFLIRTGLLDSDQDVLWTGHMDVTYAYPVYTHDRLAIVRRIRDFLQPLGIHTLGRFGEWEYANSDRCIKRGMDLAAELRAHGTSERTSHHDI